MKLIIAGGRDYEFTDDDREELNALHQGWITEVISGGAGGADAGGEAWAKAAGIPVRRFPAGWKRHGKAAGPIRNQAMADYCTPGIDAAAFFPGGRGTADMMRRAKARGLRIFDFAQHKGA